MASAAAAIDQAASSKKVDDSLWWDSFVSLFEELDKAPLSSELPPSLLDKIKSNRKWFIGSVSCFKPPNAVSRVALDSPKISVGAHEICVVADLKELALLASSSLILDEVQSYILIERYSRSQKSIADREDAAFLNLILVQYYLERQCLLKCIRRVFEQALYVENRSHDIDDVMGEALELIKSGIELNLLSVFKGLLSAANIEKLDVDLTASWVEETLVEDNLLLDILFLIYYENFSSCKSNQWKKLCELFTGILSGSFTVGKLAVSHEARRSFFHLKVQLLLILIEALDLDNLLRAVFDGTSFSHDISSFSVRDIEEMDEMVSNLTPLVDLEVGPLFLAWAIFICLLRSLPDGEDDVTLLEIDHVEYVGQAVKAASFNYLCDVLQYDISNLLDGPVSGFASVLRTLLSSFIAAYEITSQVEDNTLNLILDIVCQIYRGEEALCAQFWDRDSYVDGPIRSLLSVVENKFPYHRKEYIHLLSSLCEGSWPAECVYNYLKNLRGITLPFDIKDAFTTVNIYDIVETLYSLHIPGAEGLVIPSQTHGQIIKIIDENTVLVRWQYAESGLLMLLLYLDQDFSAVDCEDIYVIVDLLYRLVSSNTALCFRLLGNDDHLTLKLVNGQIEKGMRIDVVKIICILVNNIINDVGHARIVSVCINILVEMVKCFPAHVSEIILRANFFGLSSSDASSGAWLLSGGLARILLADCEYGDDCCQLTISVLNFTGKLLDVGMECDLISSLVVFSLQYVLVNHEHWKYKIRHARWKVTLKVFEVMKKFVKVMRKSSELGSIIRDILYGDSSVYNVLFRVMCIDCKTFERLYVNHFYDLKEVECLQHTVKSALEILLAMLLELSKPVDFNSDVPVFVQKIVTSSGKPVPVFAAVVSLVSFFSNPVIQISAFKVLSELCFLASKFENSSFETFCLVMDGLQLRNFVTSIECILDTEMNDDDDLAIAAFDLLIFAARHQPAFFVTLISPGESIKENLDNAIGSPHQLIVSSPLDASESTIIRSILKHVARSAFLIKRSSRLLLNILNFLKVLWEEGSRYVPILDIFRNSEILWKNLSLLVSEDKANKQLASKDENFEDILKLANRYRCEGIIFEIMAIDIFLFGKMSRVLSENETDELSKKNCQSRLGGANNLLSDWFENGSVGLFIKRYSIYEDNREVLLCAKVNVILCIVYLITKLSSGDTGSLSLSMVSKLCNISKKLKNHPAFSTLTTQYSIHGYSKDRNLDELIFSDLYHHLHGSIEGREISAGPFKELVQFLLELELYQASDQKHDRYIWVPESDVYIYDLPYFRAELGIEIWDYSTWRSSKIIAELALRRMRDANLLSFLSDSKCSALTAFTTLISTCQDITERKITFHATDTDTTCTVLQSSIKYLCKFMQDAEISPYLISKSSDSLLKYYIVQNGLLEYLSRSFFGYDSLQANCEQSLTVYVQLIRTSSVALQFFNNIKFLAIFPKKVILVFLVLLLRSVQMSYSFSHSVEKSNAASNSIVEASLMSLGLLPVLCKYVESLEYCNLSLASIDMIIKCHLSPTAWLPVLKKHFKLQLVVRKLRERDPDISVLVIMKFLLTLAKYKDGAKMLQIVNFFSYLTAVFNALTCDKKIMDKDVPYKVSQEDETLSCSWVLGLSIIISVVNSLDDENSCMQIVDSAILYFFSEKVDVIYRYLSAPNFSRDGHDRKRQRTQKPQTSLAFLEEIEYTIMLICTLAKHQASWNKGMKEKNSEVREACIHMLAFISKGAQYTGDSQKNNAVLVCPPVRKDDLEANKKPPFVGTANGWFASSSPGILPKDSAADSSRNISLITKNHGNDQANLIRQSKFTDIVGIQIYKIAFLLLNFLCMQAKAASKRAEEVRYIDLAHFPELPTPEILHGIQDQAITIVTDVCEANRSKTIKPETLSLCRLLLHVLEQSLYLELCVSQTYGIRPVMGHIEDFSRDFKRLLKVAGDHQDFNTSLKSLSRIICLLYPGILQRGCLV